MVAGTSRLRLRAEVSPRIATAGQLLQLQPNAQEEDNCWTLPIIFSATQDSARFLKQGTIFYSISRANDQCSSRILNLLGSIRLACMSFRQPN
jgi:hypothetical protein